MALEPAHRGHSEAVLEPTAKPDAGKDVVWGVRGERKAEHFLVIGNAKTGVVVKAGKPFFFSRCMVAARYESIACIEPVVTH